MNIIFYETVSPENVIDKALTDATTKTGNLLEDTDIIRPSIEFNFNPVGFNYAYIADFERFYYVRSIVNTGASTWRVDLEVDPLMSFKEQIKSSPCIAAKSSSVYNLYLNDPNYKCYQDDVILMQNFPTGFDDQNPRFVLTVLGDKEAVS